MTTTIELTNTIKKYYCDAGVFLEFVKYKASRSELDSKDEAFQDLELRLEVLKDNLFDLASSIKPNVGNVSGGALDDYLDLLTLKTLCESLDNYIDSIMYYVQWILEDGLWTE